MNENHFFYWLCEKYSDRTAKSRITNCRTIEQYEGDLDAHFTKDYGASLIYKLNYSKDDENNNRKSKHSIAGSEVIF
ncbi:MAG: hypothetical protein D3904_18400 [Candidatus Electrothrix sp. EH2]|nr:hypothetical protein [Candidatus Electrothrix sp. EH2]